MEVKPTEIKIGHVPFQTQGKLLQELGERLVASSEVALVELIKNAYDADSSQCVISLQKNNTVLVVEDRGHGISEEEFLHQWMQIATGEKQRRKLSPIYRRRLTGAKGIGRFAVRFLGKNLALDSVAVDKTRGFKTRLLAEFDWPTLDKAPTLSKVPIEYRLLRVNDDTHTGTKLIISERREKDPFDLGKALRAQVLKMTSPLSGLERGRFAAVAHTAKSDPGFKVIIPEAVDSSGRTQQKDIAKEVLGNYFIRATADLDGNQLTFKVFVRGDVKPVLTHKVKRNFLLSQGLFADIRFFPKRAGMFAGTDIDGRFAWSWIRDNCGISVLDHGFRIKPYGFPDDDWLQLDIDTAKNRREWRSEIMRADFAIPDVLKNTGQNPMLRLPYSSQLIGAVSVESVSGAGEDEDNDLVPSMDREGFIQNAGFKELAGIVRTATELIALQDQRENQKRLDEEARAATAKARRDFQAAIRHIQESPTLVKADKDRIISHYNQLAKQLEDVSDYERRARAGLEVMGLLGVVAGFMTHESDRIVFQLEQAAKTLEGVISRIPEISDSISLLKRSIQDFKGYREYAATFIDAVQKPVVASYLAAPQIDRVIDRFGSFARDRGIEVTNEVSSALMAPAVPVAVYSGLLLNLYSNALKAVVAGGTGGVRPRIVFRARNEHGKHTIEVLDTGIGIPEDLRDRIWDPLFTTTSRQNNPLGSGMGLGLSLVRKLVRDLGGNIQLVDAPEGFATCFRIDLPIKVTK